MNLKERRANVAVRRAADAVRDAQTRFDHLKIRLGPLTSAMCNQARWRGEEPLYPYDQVFADEIEGVLIFAQAQRQLDRCWPNLTARKAQRDSALDELRIARHFHYHGFQIVEWETLGQNGHRGEYLVAGPSRVGVFVEVKGPRWEGELKDREISAGRTGDSKYIYAEPRFLKPWKKIQFEVDKSYGKLAPTARNLLVMAGYRGFASLDETLAREALFNTNRSGCFTSPAYANLGGVGIFSMGNDVSETAYEMRIFLNPFAIESLPSDLMQAFGSERASTPYALYQ